MQFEPSATPFVGMFCFFIPLVIIITAVQILVFCKIFHKTGFSWALGLLMFIPIANIIMLFVLAFAEWPIERELRSYKQQNQIA